MKNYELKCKRMITNSDGNCVEDKVEALTGEIWSVKEAANLAYFKGVIFTYKDEKVTSLDMLPEC